MMAGIRWPFLRLDSDEIAGRDIEVRLTGHFLVVAVALAEISREFPR